MLNFFLGLITGFFGAAYIMYKIGDSSLRYDVIEKAAINGNETCRKYMRYKYGERYYK